MKRFFLITLVAFSLGFWSNAAIAFEAILKEYVKDLVTILEIPSVALTVVQGSGNMLTIVEGISDDKTKTLATTETFYKVGSISKSMTATAIGILVSRGLIDLDAPIGQYLHELSGLNKALAKVSVRRLLSHQTSIDIDRLEPLIWPQPNRYTFADVNLGLAVLSKSHRQANPFQYSNLNYVLAAEIVARTAGVAFYLFLDKEIFRPLNMDCNSGQFEQIERQKFAQPHSFVNGRFGSIRRDNESSNVGLDAGAGGIRCSITAMQFWLVFQMGVSGKRLGIDAPTWRALHRPEVLVRASNTEDRNAIRVDQYGLGLEFVSDLMGLRIEHFGGVAGMRAYMNFYPTRGIGFALLLNSDSNQARKLLIKCSSKLLLGLATKCELPSQDLKLSASKEPVSFVPPTQRQKRLIAGIYRDTYFGQISICELDSGLSFKVQKSPLFDGRIASHGLNRLAVVWNDVAIDSDSIIRVLATRSNMIQVFELIPVGKSDFDFSAMRFERVANCPM